MTAADPSGRRGASTFVAWIGLLFLLLPIAVVVPVSFTPNRYLSLPVDGWSLRHYEAIVSEAAWRSSVGDSLLVLALDNITTGGIAGGTGPGNNVFLSNISVLQTDPVFEGFQTLDDFRFFDPATLSDATPVRIGGSLQISGPVTTGGFAAAATRCFPVPPKRSTRSSSTRDWPNTRA